MSDLFNNFNAIDSDLEGTYHEDLLYEVLSLLSLSQLKGLGYWSLWKIRKNGIPFKDIIKIKSEDNLIQAFHDVQLRISHNDLSGWYDKRKEIWTKAKLILKEFSHKNITVLLKEDPRFPNSLRHIPDHPEWLFVQGNPDILTLPSIALIGTRKPTQDGLFLAKYLSALIADMGYCIISGLAEGIDSESHINAMRFHTPTVAIIGTGIYFKTSAMASDLRNKIIDCGGVIVTEYLPRQGYSAENFVRRNRLQAGLANITIPIEWKVKGGTAHTVNYAQTYGKHLIGIRMSDWSDDRKELQLLYKMNVPVFSIPGNESDIIKKIRELINLQHEYKNSVQLHLF